MNKLICTLLAIFAIAAFSQRADAALVNDRLVININVQISHSLEIQWDNGGLPGNDFVARNWNLGTAATVNLAQTCDTQTEDPIDLDIRNDTTNVPVRLDINVTDASANWDHALSTGTIDEFVIGYSVNNGGTYNATAVGGPVTNITPAPLTNGDVVNFELAITTPSSISTGNSGQIVVTVFAAAL